MTYAGDVSPQEAYAAVTGSEGADRAVLVDVRTKAEWAYVGVPRMPEGCEPLRTIEWQSFPDGTPNAHFLDELRAAGVTEGTAVYFLCRSGVRSVAAANAATAAGLGPAYNVLEGFEGPHDAAGHRLVGGWKNSGLPWVQG
jgi:rhodanese-related sulfurtransferase